MRPDDTPAGPSRSDLIASVLLPLAVILLGIAATVVMDRGVAGLVELCLTPFR